MKRFKVFSIAIMLSAFAAVSSAQTLQESTEARNKGAELMSKGDIDGAIAELEKCVTISKSIGTEADENRTVAEAAIPGLYLQKADKVLDSKDYAAALKAFEATIASAEKYNNPDVLARAKKPLPLVYLAMGTAAYQANKPEDAVKSLDQAITLDPGMARAYYIKGAVYQKMANEAKMVESFKLAIEKGKAANDNATAKNAQTALRNFYYNNGIQALKVKKTDDAIAAFTEATAADNTYADAYYRLASCYNTKQQYDNAITNGEKALELKASDGVYYELGLAAYGKKDNGKACDYFKKITADQFLKAAKYYIDIMKCK